MASVSLQELPAGCRTPVIEEYRAHRRERDLDEDVDNRRGGVVYQRGHEGTYDAQGSQVVGARVTLVDR